jgi:gluconolactonase
MKQLLGVLLFSAVAFAQQPPTVSIVRLDPAFDKLVPADAKLELLSSGYLWTEGPVWDRNHGYLLFSDTQTNTITRWEPGKGASMFLHPSGYDGEKPFTGREPGSNGLAFDAQGRLVMNQHGNRRIARLEADGKETVLVDRYQGKRLNSPNDLVFKSNGDLYFTDPAYGLPKTVDDPVKELPFQGVYRLSTDGKLTLLDKDLKTPNGIAFSPDEKILYVSDTESGTWWAYDVQPDGNVAHKRLFFDGNDLKKNGPGAPDGMKVDARGNIFAAGQAGVVVISPEGKLLGYFSMGVPTANCGWGDDGTTLYITANTNLYRIKLSTKGAGW